MLYRKRHAEAKLKQLAKHFKVVLVTGARQVGKSTLLAHLLPDVKSVVFDPVQDTYGAREDPDLFLKSFPPPVILDEVQYVPELLPALKRRVDQSESPGQYYLSGSQNLGVLRSVSESLAGRVGILALSGLTLDEMLGVGATPGWLNVYLEDPGALVDVARHVHPETENLVRVMWRGSLPGLLDVPDAVVPDYYRSYIQTYVERDIRVMGDVREAAGFGRFLSLTGALTAQEINASQLGREVGVTPDTARKWLTLLANSFQWEEVPPYHGNTIKRLSGKQKGYVSDTGMACHLQRISSPEALAVSTVRGQMFETWVVNEILRQFVNLGVPPQAFHWRTSGGAEMDLLLERDGKLFPIEVKCKTRLTRSDMRGFRAFRDTYASERIMPGLIVYAGDACYHVDEHTIALPWNAVVQPE